MNGIPYLLDDVLRPEFLIFLAGAPLLLAVGWYGLRLRKRDRERIVAPRHHARFMPGFSPFRAGLRVVLATVAAFCMGAALIGPVNGYSLRNVHRKGLDIVLCVDTSRSMLVQDVKPDRLTRARREVKGLLARLGGDRAALLAFAGDVREVAPLTHDRKTLASFVEDLNVNENLVGGTNLGLAIEKALALFDGRTGSHEAIVLITDGEDLEATGLAAAEKALERGIKIFVVGMGTADGGKIPEGTRGFVRDETGKEVISLLEGDSLRKLCELTGGTYLSSEMSPIPLEELYEKRLTQLEERDLWAGKERIPIDWFQLPLAIGLACMLLEVALRERRSVSEPFGDSK